MRSIQARSWALAAATVIGIGAVVPVAQAANPDCSTLPNHVFVYGSSAVKPLVAALSNSLWPMSISLIYVDKGGSCDGVNAIINDKLLAPGTAFYYPTSDDAGVPTAATCDVTSPDGGPSGPPVDIGVSDVWADSCPNVMPDYSKVGDFYGPNQVMTFVAPQKATSRVNISAEAAYFIMGKPANGKILDPWKDATKLAIRNQKSGTQTMLGRAIHLDASLWIGTDAASSGGVENAVRMANDTDPNPDTTLGILATTDADNDRSFLKILAFQDVGRTCAFWPDSSLTTFDKVNVRNGDYAVFGPLHLLAKVASQGGDPTNPVVKQIISYFTGKVDPPGGKTQLLDLEIKNHTVPLCAMRVKRTTEMGPLSPYTPDVPCHCYFEQKATGTVPSSCQTCTTDADCVTDACTSTSMVCGFGYCEAK